MRKRVVITGLGCISPFGNDVSSLWKGIIAGLSGVDHITHYDTREHRTKIAAEVKGFNGEALFGAREARRMDRFAQFALAAAIQAVADARLEINQANRDQVGVVLGSGIGGVSTCSTM
jgi:3-oxoacyl-[acyl-carrier-protein] synthase II